MSSTLKKTILPFAIVLLASIVTGSLILAKPKAVQITPPAPLLPVEILVAQTSDLRLQVSAQGSVSARTKTNLVSEVSGLITGISPSFRVGGFFRKGDVLLKIDDRNYRANLQRSKASVATARSNLVKEQGLSKYAKEDWSRLQLINGSKRDPTDLALRKPQLAEAQANLQFAEADLAQAQGDLSRTIIVAPYDGLVREQRVDIGQYVTTGTALGLTYAVDQAEIRLPLPDKKLQYLNLPDSYQTQSSYPQVLLSAVIAGQEHTWQAQLVRTEGVFDDSSRVLYAIASIDDPYQLASPQEHKQPLRIGTFVTATIDGKQAKQIIQLPRSVVRPGNVVWILDQENKLRRKLVTILQAEGSQVFLQAGLNAGDRVVATALDNPLPGTSTRVVKTKSSTSTND